MEQRLVQGEGFGEFGGSLALDEVPESFVLGVGGVAGAAFAVATSSIQ